MRVVHLGIDHDRYAPDPAAGPAEARDPFLLYPARRWPHKNHERLFEAFALLRRERPELRLLLTGGGHSASSLPEGVEVPPGLALPPFEVPLVAKVAILEMIGIEAVGRAPLEASLGKGKAYAVIACKKGFRAKLAATRESFNPVFLLNILNAFLLCFVDIGSGAWFNVRPTTLEIALEPLPPR